jgi:hypothetical protein
VLRRTTLISSIVDAGRFCIMIFSIEGRIGL